MINNNNQIKILALGGQDERGKNLYCIEFNDKILIFDLGSSHPDSIKNILGVSYVVANIEYLKQNVKKIKGIFITKINEWSSGAFKYVINNLGGNIPVYSSELSANVILSKEKCKIQPKIIALKPKDIIKIQDIKVEAFSTTTCFPYSLGYAIHTPIGTIIYTGDYIFDMDANNIFSTDLKYLAQIASRSKILLLMSDASSSSRIGYTAPFHKAKKYIKKELLSTIGRIILVCFNEDIYRIIELLSCINDNNIQVGIDDKILLDIFKFMYIKNDLNFYRSDLIKNTSLLKKNKKSIIIINGTRKTLYNKVVKITSGDDDKLVINENDVVILSTSPEPGSELNYANVLDELSRTEAKVITLNSANVYNINPSFEDVKMMTNIFKPKYFMPVRSLYKEFIKANLAAIEAGVKPENTILIKNGDLLIIDNKEAKVISNTIDPAFIGDVFITSFHNYLNDFNPTILKERKNLATDGVLIIGASIYATTKLLYSLVDVQLRGVLYINNYARLTEDIKQIVKDKIEEYKNYCDCEKVEYDLKELKKTIRYSLNSYNKKNIGKRPTILTFINEINETD